MKLSSENLKEFLDYKYSLYNNPDFIETDPISIPHSFTKKEDIEIAGFLTATISWGNRSSILKSARRLMEMLDQTPYDFIMHAGKKDLQKLQSFVHRTFNGSDCIYFITSLKNIYKNHGGLKGLLSQMDRVGAKETISGIRSVFLEINSAASSPAPLLLQEKGTGVEVLIKNPGHVAKHLPEPMNGAAAKRINMFLRWMVRQDNSGVDFGLWNSISPSNLMCPLDVHSGNVARKLGLLTRKSNDWKAVEELTAKLRELDPVDPVKYDFALFGLGVFEKF